MSAVRCDRVDQPWRDFERPEQLNSPPPHPFSLTFCLRVGVGLETGSIRIYSLVSCNRN